ncbi:MAG: zinc-binding dehydrogenase [Candidatus Jordarchaeaceae archaeon]
MEATMRAARFYKAGEPLTIEELPIPKIGAGEVLIKVKACGICGTDVHIARDGTIPPAKTPITLGHEIAGEIAEIGEGVEGWKIGDKVLVISSITCGACYACRSGREALCVNAQILGLHVDGGLADYLKIPKNCLTKIPEGVPFEQAAIIDDAVATPYHAIITRGNLRLGETVAIFGCGGLGSHAIQIAKLAGASKIIAIDVSDEILERSKMLGADFTINSAKEKTGKRISEITEGKGVDLALEFVGMATTIDRAVKSIRKGGRAVIVGIGPEKIELVSPYIFVYCEDQVLGSFGSNKEEIDRILELIKMKKLDLSRSISQMLKLEQVNEGLERLEKKVGNPIRIVIQI